MAKLSKWSIASALFLICLVLAVTASSQIVTKIADLGGNFGSNPQGMSFIQGTDGNLYGMTANQRGTIFRITPSGAVTTLYSFCSQPNCTDGNYSLSSLTLATDGNFYGVTYQGGIWGGGTVFKLTGVSEFTTIYNFCMKTSCVDGLLPVGGLVEGTDGYLYGTTAWGGTSGAGTIFRINTSGLLTTIHSFTGIDGDVPFAALVQGDDEFYGTTQRAGPFLSYYGNVFKVARDGTVTSLITFSAGSDAWPSSPLVRSGNNFYGAATGGTSGSGAIFSITPQGSFTNLFYFCQPGCQDGSGANGLTLGTDGKFYGTTLTGGCAYNCGTIFQFANRKLSTLYTFCVAQDGCPNGALPWGGLYQATNGKFYGTTYYGGANGAGTVFTLDMGLAPFASFVLSAGRIGQTVGILGQGFKGTTAVDFNGTPAIFTVVSDTFLHAIIPLGATNGHVTVTSPGGTLTSNVPFRVIR